MGKANQTKLRELLLSAVPADGAAIGNQALKEAFQSAAAAAGVSVKDDHFDTLREALVTEGILVKGKGRGGSVRRADVSAEGFDLRAQAAPEPAEAPARNAKPRAASATPRASAGEETQILSYRHPDKRKNNPEVGMVKPENDPDEPKTTWRYDPHLDPVLAFDSGRAMVERMIDDALDSGDPAALRSALEELKRAGSPHLNWSGKAEGTSFAVDTVSLHVHERIDPMSILAAVRKDQAARKAGKGAQKAMQPGLFDAPFENLPLRDAVDFYRHEKGWSNRLIAGDSLLVMNSLLQKESMAGQVQMIYIDPPYGIKYGSNFQPFVNKRDVKDRKDEDLTQEPEMIKAFRDTWELGIHSYLTYLRDRLLLAKELLNESGSVFVQISDENLHHVREIMDEVFGAVNSVALVSYKTTGGQASKLLSTVSDYLVWYAKKRGQVKYRQLFSDKTSEDEIGRYKWIEAPDSSRLRGLTQEEENNPRLIPSDWRLLVHDNITSQGLSGESSEPFVWRDKNYGLPVNSHWKTTPAGMKRLAKQNRLMAVGETLRFKRLLNDFPVSPINAVWDDTAVSGFGRKKEYVVETNSKVIERCILMTTDPGDLVLDPTCGSGTTAFVAEKWGRRWITCDTSRVSVTLAKQRLMTASFDYYELRYPHEGLRGGFIYKTVPHVTLKSIANNPEIDEIYARLHPAIEAALARLNKSLKEELKEWEVPFDFPAGWPDKAREAFDAFHAARQAMQKQMDLSIAAHADQETLYDQPEKSRSKLRITGPFSVEAVPSPTVLALETLSPNPSPASGRGEIEADVTIARSGESSRQHQWRDELFRTGIRGKGGQMLRFAELETLPDTRYLHASGTLADSGERVVVSFGPEHAALEQRQVTLALNEAETLRPAPKFVVFCAFTFDPEAAKDIDETRWPGVTLLKAQMNTDLLTEDLKKARSSNQSFWLMGQPDVEVRKRKDGLYECEVHGFDYFDTVKGELVSGGKGKIALWLLDTDYDERSLFPRQVFFPMAGKDEGWMKLKRDIRAELDESQLAAFHGTVSRPFEAGENHKVAVKIVDDRGIESLKIVALD